MSSADGGDVHASGRNPEGAAGPRSGDLDDTRTMSAMEDLELAIAAARAGGKIVAEGFGRHSTTVFKGRNDPVTEIDEAAELAITDLLAAHRPADGLLGEEGTSHGGDGRRWLIDPLDGTVNFVHGFPHVGVSVGLYDGNEPLVGVVYDPIHDEMFAAAIGAGATLNGAPISVSATPDLAAALVVTGFPYDHHDHAPAYVSTLGAVLAQVNGIRRTGSAALDLCYVAAGRFDGYWEYQLAPWDLAGGLVILAEAGGRCTTPSGAPTNPYTRHIVAGNPLVHEPLRQLVEGSFPAHLVTDATRPRGDTPPV